MERALTKLGRTAQAGDDQRAPARNSPEYDARRRAAVSEVEALCDRITRRIKRDLADIEDTVGPIAEPMADRLAKGAVADVFEAAAVVLKREIRNTHHGDDARDADRSVSSPAGQAGGQSGRRNDD